MNGPQESGSGPKKWGVDLLTLELIAPAVDFAAIIAAALLSETADYIYSGSAVSASVFLAAAAAMSGCFVGLMQLKGLYGSEALLDVERQIKWILTFWFSAFALVLILAFFLRSSSDLSRAATAILSGAGFAALCCTRFVWRYSLPRVLQIGFVRPRPAALVTFGHWDLTSERHTCIARSGRRIAMHMQLPTRASADDWAAALARLTDELRGSVIQEVFIGLPTSRLDELNTIVDRFGSFPLPIRVLPDARISRLILQPIKAVGDFALIEVKRGPLSPIELALKRGLDLVIAVPALIGLAPLFCLVITAIRLDTEGPVFFRQTRQGFNGRTFRIIKFRTMLVLEDGPSIPQATKYDRRVTRIGRMLRRSSIDELPQLWNVVVGDMSIIGPRPHALAHDDYYDTVIENYAFRQHVKPGLTGWAQVNGLRGETPQVELMGARVEHDLWYINNWSIHLDMRILLLTCFKLFSKAAY